MAASSCLITSKTLCNRATLRRSLGRTRPVCVCVLCVCVCMCVYVCVCCVCMCVLCKLGSVAGNERSEGAAGSSAQQSLQRNKAHKKCNKYVINPANYMTVQQYTQGPVSPTFNHIQRLFAAQSTNHNKHRTHSHPYTGKIYR
jgi:hypothetical protein